MSRRQPWQRASIGLGLVGLPFAGFAVYDRLHPLPPPLGDDTGYPLAARFWMQLAMRTHEEKYLEHAMASVLRAGLGPASPQATNLTMQLAQWHLENPTMENLQASLAALLHKPHVGEAIREERRRLYQALTVTRRLYELMKQSGKEAEAMQLVKETMATINGLPSFIARGLSGHPDLDRLSEITLA